MVSLAAFSADVCGVVGFDEGSKALPQAFNCPAASWNPTLRTAIVTSIVGGCQLPAAAGSTPVAR